MGWGQGGMWGGGRGGEIRPLPWGGGGRPRPEPRAGAVLGVEVPGRHRQPCPQPEFIGMGWKASGDS